MTEAGAVFDDLDAGIAQRDALGFEQVLRTTTAAADAAPAAHVFAGFSLGGWFAHHLARTRPGATGLLLLHEGEPDEEHTRGRNTSRARSTAWRTTPG